MQFSEQKKANVLVFRINESRLDSGTATEFKTQLYRVIQTEGNPNVLLDFREVQYVDSSGLGAILFGQRQARSRSGEVKLLHLNPKIEALIKIAKLDHVLEIYGDEDEALKSFEEDDA